MPQAVAALFMLIRKTWERKRPERIRRWMVYASVLMACMFYDIGGQTWSSYISISTIGLYYYDPDLWPALTGIIAPLWLVGLWIWNDRPLPDETEIDQLYARRPRLWALPRSVFRVSTRITTTLKSNDPKRRTKKKMLYLCCIVYACGFNTLLSSFLPHALYLGLTFTYSGLYSLLKLRGIFPGQRGSSFWKGALRWLLFAAVVGFSDEFWWFTDYGLFSGSPVLFPMLAWLVIYSKAPIFTTMIQWFRGFRGTASATTPGDQGQQVAQGDQQV